MTLASVSPIDAGADVASAAGRSRRPAVVAALVVGLTALALALRLEGIATWYWIDETLSVGLARQGFYEIPSLLLRDGSPPLWYFLLHGWTAAFGTSATATHALSVVFGVVIVPVAWFAARRLFGARAAWFSAVLATISPFVTYFAHETRMYALVVVLGLTVASTFIRTFVDDEASSQWWFVAALTALLYTHNWGLYTAVACAVALAPVWLASADRRRLARRGALTFVAVALLYLPWVPALLSQIQNTGAPWSFTPTVRGVVTELAALFRDERVFVAITLGTATGLLPLASRWRSRDAQAAVSLFILAVVPVLIGWGLSHLEPSWATRYLAVIVGPMLLLAGAGLARAGVAGVAAAVIAAMLILQPLSRLDGLPLPRSAKSNARGLAVQMSPRLAAGDLVLVVQPEAVPLLALELGTHLTYADPTGEVGDPSLMDWRGAERRLRQSSYADDVAPLLERLPVGGRALIVLPGNASRSTDTDWIKLFRAKGRRIHQALRRDEAFAPVAQLRGSGGEYVTVNAVLFERVTDRP